MPHPTPRRPRTTHDGEVADEVQCPRGAGVVGVLGQCGRDHAPDAHVGEGEGYYRHCEAEHCEKHAAVSVFRTDHIGGG